MSSKDVVVYVDMVADLFHLGHVEILRKAKAMGSVLKVGVHSDADVQLYKRLPVCSMSERIAVVEVCKYVDEVIPNAPLTVTEEYLVEHGIDIVVHGDDLKPELRDFFYSQVAHRLRLVTYTGGISTTNILQRAAERQLHSLAITTPPPVPPVPVPTSTSTSTSVEEEEHGGQDVYAYSLDTLVADFSVTTNLLGSPESAVKHIQEVIQKGYISLYPCTSQEPYRTTVTDFLFRDLVTKREVLLGNGASELIDLVVRNILKTTAATATAMSFYAPFLQYREYARVCQLHGLIPADSIANADVVCVVNPCNPSGKYLDVETLLRDVVHTCRNGAHVLVDESMQLWHGPHFRQDSLLSRIQELEQLQQERGIKTYIIHSWTKIFSCTGLRIGSVVCPDKQTYRELKTLLPAWNCNIVALEFLHAALISNAADDYLQQTWEETRRLRELQKKAIHSLFPAFTVYGEPFLSWLWIDTGSTQTADAIYTVSKNNHMPIRHGKVGYDSPSFVRVAVREMPLFARLVTVWQNQALSLSLSPKYLPVCTVGTVSLDKLVPHEQINESAAERLYEYLVSLNEDKIAPTIIVNKRDHVIIDGHHRFHAFKKLGLKVIDVLFVQDYAHCDDIVLRQFRGDSIEDSTISNNSNNFKFRVVQKAQQKQSFPPKTTLHAIYDENGELVPIVHLSQIVSL